MLLPRRLIHFSSSFAVSLGADSMNVMFGSDLGENRMGLNSIGINDADWHRLALTFSGEAGAAIVYLDGVEIGRVSGLEGAVQTGSASHPLYLGSPWTGGFADLIDNFQFWRGAMSAAEIEALSTRAQDGKFAPLDGTASEPVVETTEEPVDETPTEPVDDTTTEPVDETPSEPADETPTEPVEDTSLDFSDVVFDGEIIGTAGDDNLQGHHGAYYIDGLGGDDTLRGKHGNDVLLGGDGDDNIHGGDGDDVMVGGMGRDILKGVSGKDTFMFTDIAESLPGHGAQDRIQDFTPGEDKIDVSRIDAVTGGGHDAFVFIGTDGFSAAGQMRQFESGRGSVIEADVDGNGRADFQIALLTTTQVLTQEDFVA